MLKQRLLFSHPMPANFSTLYSWGSSVSYATGQNTTSAITLPTAIGSMSTWTKVVSFGGNAVGYGGFAIKSDGSLWSWGDSSNYGTAQSTTTNIQIPTKVGTDTNWIDIAGFGGGGFALKSNGRLYSWGESANYQTGQNITTNVQFPTQVGTDTDWVKISAFAQGGFAIKSNGTLWSWGYTISYATGQGSALSFTVPTQIGTDTNWLDVFGGAYGGIALKTNKSLWSWGSSSSYATGQNTLTDIQVPTQIGTDTNWVAIAMSSYTGYALKQDGSLWSWGNSASYATGQNTLTNIQVPTRVGTRNDWAAVFGGFTSSTGFARDYAGNCYSWGSSSNYEGGNGSTGSITVPAVITGAAGWGSFSASTSVFAINGLPLPVFGSLFAWGLNALGQTAQNLASGLTTTPTLSPFAANNWLVIAAGNSATGATGGIAGGIQSDNTLWTWGTNAQGSGIGSGSIGQGSNANDYFLPTQVGTDTDWAALSMGYYGGVAIKSNGTLWSFGMDVYGQLGQGGGSSLTYVPTQIGTDTDWEKVYCGFWLTILIKTTGTMWVMGNNFNYATGRGLNSGQTTSPTQVGVATDWDSATPGLYGGLAIKTTGQLYSWGTDVNGELAQGTSGGVYTAPVQCGTDTDWEKARANSYFFGPTFIIKNTGTLWTCGSNATYGTGRGTNSGSTTTVTQIGSSTWLDVYPLTNQPQNAFSGVALNSDGTIYTWGSNFKAQTGLGLTSGATNNPTQISTTVYTDISANSGSFCLALK